VVAQVSDWFEKWSEPIRARSRHAGVDHFNRNSTWFGIATSPFLRDWFRPFSEPVRSRTPIPRGASPYFFIGINYVQYTFAIMESGDTMSLTMAEYPRRNRARVAITEIPSHSANVTITEIDAYFGDIYPWRR
jgi:hypothetical protein